MANTERMRQTCNSNTLIKQNHSDVHKLQTRQNVIFRLVYPAKCDMLSVNSFCIGVRIPIGKPSSKSKIIRSSAQCFVVAVVDARCRMCLTRSMQQRA